MKDPQKIKRGDELELQIESLAYGGKGIARVDDFVIFVKNAIPGQKVRALVYKKWKGYGEARPLEVLTESPIKLMHLVTTSSSVADVRCSNSVMKNK